MKAALTAIWLFLIPLEAAMLQCAGAGQQRLLCKAFVWCIYTLQCLLLLLFPPFYQYRGLYVCIAKPLV
jgi:hypothetical protein